MRTSWLLTAVAVASLLAGQSLAQSPAPADDHWLLLAQVQPTPPPAIPGPPSFGGVPVPPSPVGAQPPATAPPRANEPGSFARAHIAPHMIGDLAARAFVLRIQPAVISNVQAPPPLQPLPPIVPPQQGQPPQPPRPPLPSLPVPPPQPPQPPQTTRIPIVCGGAFKIAENESPRPLDRLFVTYTYYNNVTTFGGRDFDLHREVFGFEKTFLGGDASFGMRVPVLQRSHGDGTNFIDGFGDLSLIFKYAVVNDAETGDVLSGGLVLTVPTGRDVRLFDGTRLDSTFIQPWVGFIRNAGRAYVHGFSSLVVPTESRDVTFLNNDLGVGYRLYQAEGDELISLIAPTVEGHLFTPLSNRGDADVIRAWDGFTLTTGVHVGLRNRAFLTVGVGVPLVGPRPNDYEALAQFNLRF